MKRTAAIMTTKIRRNMWSSSLCFAFFVLMMVVLFPSYCLGRSSADAAAAAATVNVPTFSLRDLLSGRRSEELSIVLQTTGLLAVVVDDDDGASSSGTSRSSSSSSSAGGEHAQQAHGDEYDDLDDLATTALQGLCRCTSDNAPGFLSMDGTDTIALQDSDAGGAAETTTTTRRTTLATATVGTTPLPLPMDQLATHCGLDTANALDALRDRVAVVSDAFIQALDQLLLTSDHTTDHAVLPALLRNVDGGSYASVSAIRNAANHLEHFHVYQKEVDENKTKDSTNNTATTTLAWHTDAGLFLAFVPAINCNDNSQEQQKQPDHSFWFMDSGTTPRTPLQAIFPAGSVAIMLGAGAEHWLDTSAASSSSSSTYRPLQLQATQHAVKMHSGDVRAWYGMMHLVPDRAIIQSSPTRRTFADMKRAMTLSSTAARKFGGGDADDEEQQQQQSPSIGCGFSADDDHHADKASSSSFSSSRRRLQHVQSAGECNNVTNFFCWMQCLEVPNHEQARGFLNEGYSLYCLDPATLASSGNRVSSAAAPCEYGYVHNAACQGSWQPTAPGVNAYPLNVEDQDEDGQQELAFCYGGTSMYMDGFHWLHPTCVIYLFPKWVLSTPGKLAAAAIGTLFSGMALEKIIQQRRFVVASMDPGYKRLGVSSLFYAVQLTLGYLIMLVVMTYSGPLFLSVVLGLVGGHVLFNASDAFFPGKKKAEEAPSHASSDKMNDDDSGDGEGCCSDGPAAYTDKTTNCSKMENNRSTGSCCKEETSCGTKSPDVHVPEGITPCCLNTL